MATCLGYSLTSLGQKSISGTVYNPDSLGIRQVSVVLTDLTTSTILDYTYTDVKGSYQLAIHRLGRFNLRFSHLGYATENIEVEITESDKEKRISVFLDEKTMLLDEVIIQTERPVSIKKDTISFRTKYFADGTEQTVEQLLQKIPGLQIDKEGTIKVGNQEIEKLMVDGDDLFEKGYRILSKNMPAYPIEEVEVLNNYSNNRLLKGVEESDKVALNLKLDEKSKRIWFGNAEVSLGNNGFYQVKSNLMNFGKKDKFYFLTNLNNIGYDATGDIENLIRPFRMNEPASIGDNQRVNSLFSLSPNQLNVNQSRIHFNQAELVSLNAIFNPKAKLKVKTLGFFNWDETDFFMNSIDAVNASGANFTNTKYYDLRNKKRIAFAKMDITYDFSKTKLLEATTKYNKGDFNDGANLVFNGNSTIERLQHLNTLFDQKINYAHKFKENNVFLLTGRFIDEKTPQNYQLNPFFYQELFPEHAEANTLSQLSENQMQFAGINAHLLDRRENGHLMEFQLGNEYRKDKLSTAFTLLDDETVLEQPIGYQNETTYQVNDLYVKSKYRLKVKDWGFTGKLDFHQLLNQLDNNGQYADNDPCFINPSIGFDWQINDKNKVVSSYSYHTTNAEILDVYNEFALTGFRSFSKGTGTFNQLDASNFVFNYQLGNWSDRFFANTFILYSKSHDFFSTNTVIEQDFTQAEKILIKDRVFVTVNSKFDYYIKSISSNLKLDLGYTQSEFKNIVNGSDFREVISKNYNLGLELRSGFKGIFNYHIGTRWTTTAIQTSIESSFTDNVSFLDLSWVFNDRADVQIQWERYYFGNFQTDNTYYFLDIEARYQLIEDKLTVGLTGANLFNTERFRHVLVSDIGTSTTEYKLLPGLLRLTLDYRF